MQSIRIIKRMRSQLKSAHALLCKILSVQKITHRERVVFVQRKIQPRTEIVEFLGCDGSLADRQRIERSIQRGGADDCGIVDVPAIEVEEERSTPGQWTTQIAFNSTALIRWTIRGKRITGIENCVTESKSCAAMKFAGARLGKNLNVAEADPFVFGRKRILINHDLANGLLIGQNRPGRKTTDKDLRAAGFTAGPVLPDK